MDMHQDSPVEILHSILLRPVKYLWRDAIERCNKAQLKQLCFRLEGLDTHGLDFAPLNGNALVNFAGSLYGADFRKLAQLAHFVIGPFVGKELLRAWQALGRLTCLVFQPDVDTDMDSYIVSLASL
jgi:hypothetical protein